ncbi:uncharacterized protein LACBIDRAFT_297827 [Laccaria bicolor S238N-H82]|uniref:Predicted protein n=1 Tax=Laccaria bicolor (strain S238N-H82 / ATCC MYA-4686) TaxID=486041 RepID=B0DAZ7_LACBS|nr:uncharacterized protein LACBIDRAFT_297827 [Laccaria bicolor S238N-H82]EDR08293.1 predicted protein [Laccaria bicolor S238N-H82]|eukprot:XP_001881363.1 predicted protein [Laccaria bicolor S238N-H82]
MSAPPVPPRPYYESTQGRDNSLPPPVPPLPPAVRNEAIRYATPSPYEESPPHFERPLVAPRPHRLDPSIPANMARTLDDQIRYDSYQQQPPWSGIPGGAPPANPINANGSLGMAAMTPNSLAPGQLTPGAVYPPPPTQAEVAQSLANLSLTLAPLPPSTSNNSSIPSLPPPTSNNPNVPQPPPPAASNNSSIPSLTSPLPTLAQLSSAANIVQSPTHDPKLRIAWCRDVFFLIDKANAFNIATTNPTTSDLFSTPPSDSPVGPIIITDPALLSLSQIAVPLVLQLASSSAGMTPLPSHVAEALYLRAKFAATGAYPAHIPQNPRAAFRDFEAAARGGYPGAWFRIGRDYENFCDATRAKDCYERGIRAGVESCLYRMGMAHLLGQLGLPANPQPALPLLHRAALLSSLETPQPAYVYALLLLSEFTSIAPLPPSLFAPYIPPGSSPTLEARKHLERAAYLHFPAAQYKLGHAYEFAEPPFGFDPLLSVQYYSLASQAGEVEADMALSKWFLCGSGAATAGSSGHFDKDESLALTFASKAARRGLPSAEFALGYYAEVGVGRPKDLLEARTWYEKACDHGNADAIARLQALSASTPAPLSRVEHDTITETKLVRKRTQAQQRSEAQPLSPPWEGRTFPTLHEQQQQGQVRRKDDGRTVVEVIRKNSAMEPPMSKLAQLRAQQQPKPQNTAQAPQVQPYPAGQNRYQLSDSSIPPPTVGGSPGLRTESPGQIAPSPVGGRPGRMAGKLDNAPGRQSASPATVAVAAPTPKPTSSTGKKPATFAEMGFHSAQVEEKECIIM